MLSDVINNYFTEFLGSELYRKMCPFVSLSCLLQKLATYNYLNFSGLVQRIKNKAFVTLFHLGTQYNLKVDTWNDKEITRDEKIVPYTLEKK